MKLLMKKTKHQNMKYGRTKRLNEKIRFCEKVYGEKLFFKSEEELYLWLVTKDPYVGELFLLV